MQTLAHLGAAVVQLHAAVLIDEYQRARLVEEGGGERDAELHRRDGEAAFLVRVLRIEVLHLGPARLELTGLPELRPDVLDAPRILHQLVVMGAVALGVEVALADHVRRQIELARDAVEASSIISMPCGPPKPRNAVAELCASGTRGPRLHVRHEVAVVGVEHATQRTGDERSRLQPPSLNSAMRAPSSLPVSSKPASKRPRNGWRLPVITMSSWRDSRTRTGLPVSREPSAASAAQGL